MQYPYPYGRPPLPPPPPKSGSNVAIIVLVVIVALVVVGAGGCLVCGMIVGMGAAAGGAEAGSPTSTVDRTPIAVQLEGALQKDGIPFDHVECPIAPPSSGSFSCAVVPANEGDPAEITVTNGPNGMSYKLQEGFVVLEGAKLAATFERMTSSGLTVPCFRGKILKHADTSFTCDVQGGGGPAGHVTTQVVGRSGDVKMDYQPLAKGGGVARSLDGTYACLTLTYRPGTFTAQFVPSALPRFTITGGSYTSGNKTGMIRTSGPQIVLFLDGAYDGWQGLLGSNSTGTYILFRARNQGDAQPGVSTKVGDHQCYLQK